MVTCPRWTQSRRSGSTWAGLTVQASRAPRGQTLSSWPAWGAGSSASCSRSSSGDPVTGVLGGTKNDGGSWGVEGDPEVWGLTIGAQEPEGGLAPGQGLLLGVLGQLHPRLASHGHQLQGQGVESAGPSSPAHDAHSPPPRAPVPVSAL